MEVFRLKNGQLLEIRKAVPEDAAQLLAYLPLIGAESDNLLFGKEGLSLIQGGRRPVHHRRGQVSAHSTQKAFHPDGGRFYLS